MVDSFHQRAEAPDREIAKGELQLPVRNVLLVRAEANHKGAQPRRPTESPCFGTQKRWQIPLVQCVPTKFWLKLDSLRTMHTVPACMMQTAIATNQCGPAHLRPLTCASLPLPRIIDLVGPEQNDAFGNLSRACRKARPILVVQRRRHDESSNRGSQANDCFRCSI